MPESAAADEYPTILSHHDALLALVKHRNDSVEQWTQWLCADRSFDPDKHTLVPWPYESTACENYCEMYYWVPKRWFRTVNGERVIGDGTRNSLLAALSHCYGLTVEFPLTREQRKDAGIALPGTREYRKTEREIRRARLKVAPPGSSYNAPPTRKRQQGRIF